MQLFSLIAVGISCAVNLFMAVRLFLLARRTGELPELMIGGAFMAGGMIGYPFNVAASALAEASRPEMANASLITGQVGMALAAFFLLMSWERIFHPGNRVALVFVAGWGALMGFVLVVNLKVMTPGSIEHLSLPIYWGLLVTQGVCYATLGWSSYQHSRRLERRSAIGLADPVVANRLLLWSCSNASITSSYLYAIVVGLMLYNGMGNFYQPILVVGFGLGSAFFITLAFFPPRAYLARIRGRVSTAEGV
jgi:hypothetical protein